MHRLGGKIIPNSNPPVRFKLNHNSTRLQPGEADTSIWVGDLTPEVDDFALYRFFTRRYHSIRCAKVVLDESGFSKGYGFVRFGSEAEQQHALSSMSGEMGLGSKPIKTSMANQKSRSENGGGVSPPSSIWGGGVSPWHPPTSGETNGWGQPTRAQPGRSWSDIGGTPSSPPSGGSGGPLAAATSSGLDYSAYHQYYQQYAQQQQQQYAAAWVACQQAQQQAQQQQQQP